MLKNYWYIACKASELRRLPVAFSAFDQHLVAFRDAGGKPGVLIDRCAHRNAPLSCGKVKDGLLQCPYHGWSYNTEGELVNAPACAGIDDSVSKSVRIPAYRCVEQDGYIWFTSGTTPASKAPPRFAFMNEAGWTTFTMDTLFDGPVDTCLENFLDCPHATFVHQYWFRKPTARLVKAVVQTTKDGAQAEYFDEPREGSVIWSMLSRKKSTMRHIDRFIAPATSRVDYELSDGRHYVVTSSCTPVTDKQTRVHTVITFKFPYIGWFIRIFFKPLSRLIIKQDVAMVKLQQQNIDRFGGKHYCVIAQDLLHKHIVKWRNCIENNKPLPEPGDVKQINLVL